MKIDALSLRERVIVFVLLCVLIICVFTVSLFDRQISKIKQLSLQASQAEASLVQARKEVRQSLISYQDPDAENRERLKALQQELPEMRETLLGLQKGLVSPERMTALLERFIRRNAALELVSLKTLPAANLAAQELVALRPASAEDALSVATALVTSPDAAAVHTHGVEIVVQGSYLDILNYVRQLESMPWQLLWGQAKLEVKEYPVATMTLTVYSLSLDKKWMSL